MASAQEPGMVRIVVERKNGFREVLHEARVEMWGQGGSSDGAIATATSQDLKAFLPLNSTKCRSGDKIIVMFKADAADGLDASDGVKQIPIIKDGIPSFLVNADLGEIDFDVNCALASHWIDLGTGYTVPDGSTLMVGGGKIFLSVEDDA